MANQGRKRKRASHKLETVGVTIIPSAQIVVHNCSLKKTVQVKISSRHLGASYRLYLCPLYPITKILVDLERVLQADAIILTPAKNLILIGTNGTNAGARYDLRSQEHMANIISLISDQQRTSGKTSMRISRGSIPIFLWLIAAVFGAIHYYKLTPKTRYVVKSTPGDRPSRVTTTRLRTGHIPINKYLKTIGKRVSRRRVWRRRTECRFTVSSREKEE